MGRIGIFSGTFDPIHKGHIAFALQAIKAAELDEVYFMAESKPRRKDGVTHYSHRITMLKLALRPHRNLKVLEVPDKQFNVQNTMPRLLGRFKNSQLFLLLGSDTATGLSNINQWPGGENLFKKFGLIIGLRGDAKAETISSQLVRIQELTPEFIVLSSKKRHASSQEIRNAVVNGEPHEALLKAITVYIKKNWLYESVAAGSVSKS